MREVWFIEKDDDNGKVSSMTETTENEKSCFELVSTTSLVYLELTFGIQFTEDLSPSTFYNLKAVTVFLSKPLY